MYKSWFHKFWFGVRCVSWGGQRFTATRQKKIEFLKHATCASGVKDFSWRFQFYAIFRWSSYANSIGEFKKISSLLWIWSTFRVWVLVSHSAQGSSALGKHVKIFYHAGLLLNCLLKLKKDLKLFREAELLRNNSKGYQPRAFLNWNLLRNWLRAEVTQGQI